MNIKSKAVAGILWANGSYSLSSLLNLVISIVLARLLVPEQFGLYAGAILIIATVLAFGQMGIREALIYTPGDLTDVTTDTAFLLNIAVGAVQCAVIFLLAPFGVLFIDDPIVVDILRALAFSPLIAAFGMTPDGLLQRRLNFKSLYRCEIFAIVVKTVFAVALAFAGYGVWSLVLAQLVSTTVRTASQAYFAQWLPGFGGTLEKARTLISYGYHILAVNLITLVTKRLDQFLIASILGPQALGFYFIGTRLPQMLLTAFTTVQTRVLFPTFSAIKDSPEALTRAMLKTTSYISFAAVPMAVGIAAVAPELTVVLFGQQWAPATTVVQVLALAEMMRALAWVTGDAFKAVGRPDIVTKLGLLGLAYAIPLVWGFIHFGQTIAAAAYAVLIMQIMGMLIRLWVCARFFDYRLSRYFNVYAAPFAAGALMYLAVWLLRHALGAWPAWLVLAVCVIAGALTYIGVMWLLARDLIRQALTAVSGVTRSRAGTARTAS